MGKIAVTSQPCQCKHQLRTLTPRLGLIMSKRRRHLGSFSARRVNETGLLTCGITGNGDFNCWVDGQHKKTFRKAAVYAEEAQMVAMLRGRLPFSHGTDHQHSGCHPPERRGYRVETSQDR